MIQLITPVNCKVAALLLFNLLFNSSLSSNDTSTLMVLHSVLMILVHYIIKY